jgi:hypothetical protein
MCFLIWVYIFIEFLIFLWTKIVFFSPYFTHSKQSIHSNHGYRRKQLYIFVMQLNQDSPLIYVISHCFFNNISAISWRSVSLVEETGVPGENHRSVANHWHAFIRKCCIEYTSQWTRFELTLVVIGIAQVVVNECMYWLWLLW